MRFSRVFVPNVESHHLHQNNAPPISADLLFYIPHTVIPKDRIAEINRNPEGNPIWGCPQGVGSALDSPPSGVRTLSRHIPIPARRRVPATRSISLSVPSLSSPDIIRISNSPSLASFSILLTAAAGPLRYVNPISAVMRHPRSSARLRQQNSSCWSHGSSS